MTKRDLFNARNSSKKLEAGMILTIVDCDTYGDKDKDGNDVTVSCLKSEDGDIYCCISATVAKSIDDLADIIADEAKVTVKVIKSTSNSGREFMQLSIQ